MKLTESQLQERRRQIENDLADIQTQVASGELDPETAAGLADGYRRRRAELDTATLVEPTVSTITPRRVAGVLLFLAATIGTVWLVANAFEDREPGEFVTGNLDQRSLDEVPTSEMEEVVAQFPEVVGMRVALAGRYFESGDFSRALPHYLTVLELEPDNPEANANLGWMTFLSDPNEAATAAAFVERSLDVAPNYGEAIFFLANIRLYGQDDPASAAELLDKLDGVDLPPEVREAVDRMLQEIQE